jgi:predicted amino acid dehydrogenase
MDRTFAFIGHPAYPEHLQRYLEWARPGQKAVSPKLLTKVFEWTPAYVVRELDRVVSRAGAVRSGLFIQATLLPEMVNLTPQQALRKALEACKLADRHGVRIMALGGHTSIAGALGPTSLASQVSGHVTTGNTFTVAMAVHQVLQIAATADLPLGDLSLAVLGGAGDIGTACAQLLAPRFGRVTVTGRRPEPLAHLARRIHERTAVRVETSTDNRAAVRDADVVIAATSATAAILDGRDFKPGALVVDIGYPKNIGARNGRGDVLIVAGGVCRMERPIDFGFDIDLPRRDLLYGCFAEALVLDFEQTYCSYSAGRCNITADMVAHMLEAGDRHGLRPAPPCEGGEILTEQAVRSILSNNPRLR